MTEKLPWSRLSNIAKSHVAANQPIEALFAEQLHRAETTPPDEWEEACRKVLKKKTQRFDTHPCLRERLKAMRISTRRALQLIQRQGGPPARDVFPGWKEIEKVLTDQLMAIFREEHLLKREMTQIILGKPR